MARDTGRQYEVWCLSCNVSFPPEARRCIHCGGRTGSARQAVTELGGFETLSFEMAGAGQPAAGMGPSSPHDPEFSPEDEPRGRSLLRAGMSVIWMVVLAAGYIWQSCTGGAG